MTSAMHTQGGYDDSLFEHLARIEDQHFWFRARGMLIATLAHQVTASVVGRVPRVLEVGCGAGGTLPFLRQGCQTALIVAVDASREGLAFAKQRGASALLQADANRLPFETGEFDLIGMFDVVEHIEDDIGLLTSLRRQIRSNGALLLTVPARMDLWSYFDQASRHCRRYELEELAEKLERTGYHIEFISPFMSLLLPLIWLTRRVQALGAAKSVGEEERRRLLERELKVVPVLNGLLTRLLAHEIGRLSRRRKMPFGTSLIAIARPA